MGWSCFDPYPIVSDFRLKDYHPDPSATVANLHEGTQARTQICIAIGSFRGGARSSVNATDHDAVHTGGFGGAKQLERQLNAVPTTTDTVTVMTR